MADPTLTELQSATEAQLRAVVDPDGCSDDDRLHGQADGTLALHINDDLSPSYTRTAKGERWWAELQRLAASITSAEVTEYVKADRKQAVDAFFALCDLKSLGRVVYALALRQQMEADDG